MSVDAASPSQALLDRSHRLGANPRNTNYAGGNTSAKGTAIDPVTGLPVDLLWVKGSGGDLATLTGAGLAVLRLDRLRAMVDTYPGVEREDEMVAAFDYCLHGRVARRRRSTRRCTAWSMRRTWTISTPTPGSRWRPRPTARR